MRKYIIMALWLTAGISISVTAFCQVFSIRKLEIEGDKVNLFYDLFDSIPSRTYTIALFSSHDNFISPVQKVSGDLGLEVKPGSNKRIIWNAREELGAAYDGMVGLEVRGRLYIPFVRLDGLSKTIKRLNPTEITWTGGTQQNILNFELYKGGEKITSFPNIANVGHYTLTMPSTIKPGRGYQFKITDSRNKDQIVFSPTFNVRRKISLLFKLIPVAAIAVAALVLIVNDKKAKAIPDPITP
jgi:hypothetical protein